MDVYYQNQRTMKFSDNQIISNEIQNNQETQDLNVMHLTLFSWHQIKKEVHRIWPQKIFIKLFTQREEQNKSALNFNQINKQTLLNIEIPKDKNLSKILQRNKCIPKNLIKRDQQKVIQPFSFNYDTKCYFQQTPIFKSLLQSPLPSFKLKYEHKIQQLLNTSCSKEKIIQISKEENPCLFNEKAAAFFIGIALTMKNENKIYQSLFFLKLACYIQPCNFKAWSQIIEMSKKQGFWIQAYYYSKTAFLFNSLSNFAEDYLLCADKIQIPPYEIRGLLSCLKRPQMFEKLIFQSSKYEMKYRKAWRGITLLNRFCASFNYKPNICYGLIILVRALQHLGYCEYALNLLQLSIKRGLSKLQAFLYFIEMKLRYNKGYLSEAQINFLIQHTHNLTIQTRYKIPLVIGEVLLNTRKQFSWSKQLIKKSFDLANKYCKGGPGKERAFRQIYFTVICSVNFKPNSKIVQLYQNDQFLLFLTNRQRFIKGETIISYNFKDWKYFLHYSLSKNYQILLKASQQHNQGRLTAQYIHVMRQKSKPLTVLNFWRKKIDEMPKSGQLWCQGGRIFSDLQQLQKASKCFEYAIHFTPQFGDSFIELLKIYLISNHFQAINQLRKNFFMSEPHYGNVLSFLLFYPSLKGLRYKFSLNQIWSEATRLIKESLYSGKFKQQPMLTAIQSYNQAFKKQDSVQIRQILFRSYQQMENKNAKF